MRSLDWTTVNNKQDVEVAIGGTDDCQFVLTLWHPRAVDALPSITVHRDYADIIDKEVVDRSFATIAEAKAWAAVCFGAGPVPDL